MKKRSTNQALPLLGFVALVLGLVGRAGEAATLYVANNGLDSPTCGALASPCRSISQAIANANDGDRVVVGPGRYGDLDGDGAFASPGDEAAEVNFGCFCMVHVDKTLTIESRAGAGATVLDAGGAAVSVVRIGADRVVFGKPRKGFTVTGGDMGIGTPFASDNSLTQASVSGNLALANSSAGFFLRGSGVHRVSGNAAVANQNTGFYSDGSHVVDGNLASVNDVGFSVVGFSGPVAERGQVVTRNVASANGVIGFRVGGGGHTLARNVASANKSRVGFDLSATGLVVSGNAAHGNASCGFALPFGIGTTTLHRNNLSGNDVLVLNCGLCNFSGAPLDATGNFWGSAAGPGVDPADDVCDINPGSATTVEPFAKKEFLIRTRPLF
jgi:hypothetical protein